MPPGTRPRASRSCRCELELEIKIAFEFSTHDYEPIHAGEKEVSQDRQRNPMHVDQAVPEEDRAVIADIGVVLVQPAL